MRITPLLVGIAVTTGRAKATSALNQTGLRTASAFVAPRRRSLLLSPPAAEGSGPRGRVRRERRTTSSPRSPDSDRRRRAPTRRTRSPPANAPGESEFAKAPPPFDARRLAPLQQENVDAPSFCLGPRISGTPVDKHFHVHSLSEIFPTVPHFSQTFARSTTFRQKFRHAVRQDIFCSNEEYAGLSEKARTFLLSDASASIQGSWICPEDGDGGRMERTTEVLREHLSIAPDGTAARGEIPTGEMFMQTIGDLCGGSGVSGHFIDIVGIQGRSLMHSWHQDTGRSRPRLPSGADPLQREEAVLRTVLLGVPAEDDYVGPGVFSHVVRLQDEAWADDDHPWNVPIVFSGEVQEKYVIRPVFCEGREVLTFRDVDVLHSAPDVCYRESLMRFM